MFEKERRKRGEREICVGTVLERDSEERERDSEERERERSCIPVFQLSRTQGRDSPMFKLSLLCISLDLQTLNCAVDSNLNFIYFIFLFFQNFKYLTDKIMVGKFICLLTIFYK